MYVGICSIDDGGISRLISTTTLWSNIQPAASVGAMVGDTGGGTTGGLTARSVEPNDDTIERTINANRAKIFVCTEN
jgi:hypothetical protein